jgi:hypothetical protein
VLEKPGGILRAMELMLVLLYGGGKERRNASWEKSPTAMLPKRVFKKVIEGLQANVGSQWSPVTPRNDCLNMLLYFVIGWV